MSNSWESVVAALAETTRRMVACDPAGTAQIESLAGQRAAQIAMLAALPVPCPAHLAADLEKIRAAGDRVCALVISAQSGLQSELSRLLLLRSILSVGLHPHPPAIDFTA